MNNLLQLLLTNTIIDNSDENQDANANVNIGNSEIFTLDVSSTSVNMLIEFRLCFQYDEDLDLIGAYKINWGDGTLTEIYYPHSTQSSCVTLSHTYAEAGTYTISMSLLYCTYFNISSGTRFIIGSNYNWAGLGNMLTSLKNCFSGCSNLTSNCTKLPTNVTNVTYLFQGCNKMFIDLNSIVENAGTDTFAFTSLDKFGSPGVNIYGNWVPFLRKCPNLTSYFTTSVNRYKNEHSIGDYGKSFECTVNIKNDNDKWGFKALVSVNETISWLAIDWGDGNEEMLTTQAFINKWHSHYYSKAGTYKVQFHGFNIQTLICEYALSYSHQYDEYSLLSNVKFLPENSQHIEYIKSTGSQYISTNIYPTQSTFIYSLFIKDTEQSNSVIYSSDKILLKYAENNLLNVQYGDITLNNINSEKLSEIKIHHELNSNEIVLNNNIFDINNTNNFTSNQSLLLFAKYNGNSIDITNDKIKIYDFLISDNNNIFIHDLIPILDSNNIPCLYDIFTNEYYYGNSETDFEYEIDSYFAITINITNYSSTNMKVIPYFHTNEKTYYQYCEVIDWGDGVASYTNGSDNLHYYQSNGTYIVKVKGNCQQLVTPTGSVFQNTGTSTLLISVNNNWAAIGNITKAPGQFKGCISLNMDHINFPKYIENCNNMFVYCNNLTTSSVSDLHQYKYLTSARLLFGYNSKMTANISSLPENLTDGSSMFDNCHNLDININSIPSTITNISQMFYEARNAKINLDTLAYNIGDTGWSNIQFVQSSPYINIRDVFYNCPLVSGSRTNFISKLPSSIQSVLSEYIISNMFYNTNTTE